MRFLVPPLDWVFVPPAGFAFLVAALVSPRVYITDDTGRYLIVTPQ